MARRAKHTLLNGIPMAALGRKPTSAIVGLRPILLKNSIARAIGRAYKADDLAAFAIFSIGTGY